MNKRYTVIGVIACMAAWLTGCGRPIGVSPEREKTAPESARIHLVIREATPEANVVNLDQFVDQAVLLNVWAVWSLPCREECAEMNRLYEKYRDRGLVIVGVLLDKPEDPMALSFVQSQNLLYSNGWVDNLTNQPPFSTMRVIPTKYLLNRGHEPVGAPIEGIVPEEELQRRIEELL